MNLYNLIMNIRVNNKLKEDWTDVDGGVSAGWYAYKEGHRDARHAAAELSLKHERILSDLMDHARKILCSSQFDELDEYLTKLENKQ